MYFMTRLNQIAFKIDSDILEALEKESEKLFISKSLLVKSFLLVHMFKIGLITMRQALKSARNMGGDMEQAMLGIENG